MIVNPREKLLAFIKKNSSTTYREIRKETGIHPERIFKSLEDAFKEAGVKPPRTFKIKTVNEKRKIIINFIKKNPKAGGHTINKETKINHFSIFKKTKDAFDAAGVPYPRDVDERSRKAKIQLILDFVRNNPIATMDEIMKGLKVKPYNFFNSVEEIYEKAGIKPVKKSEKWNEKKRIQVIKFIKANQFATQREINKSCKTHVQRLFKKGIFEAFKEAGIKYPFERLKLYGTAKKEIKKRAQDFEEEIATKLSGYGKVNRLVRTKRGIADVVFERKGKKAIIEIKDYQKKEISISQINQLNGYLNDLGFNLGFLICRKKPKKDKFFISNNQVFVIEESKLNKIPEIMG